MQAQLTHHTPTRKAVEITVPAAEVTEEFGKVLAKVGGKVRIPGFRPGKAPKDVLLSRFGREIHHEVADNLLDRYFKPAAQQVGIQPISFPALQKAQLKDGQDGVLTANFDVAPEVTLPEYKGLKITKRKRLIDKAALEEHLEALRQEAVKYIPVEEPLAFGHFATVDLRVKPQGMKSQDFQDQVIELTGVRPLDKELVGMKVDESRAFTLTVPLDDANRHLAGKKVAYEAKLKDVRKRELPELNDEFAKDMGDYKDLAALKKFVKEKLEEAAEQDALVRMQSSILEVLLDAAPFEVPASMTGLQLDDYCQELMDTIKKRGLDARKVNWSSYRQSRLRDAERAVRSGYLLQALGNAENIQVGDEELDKEIQRLMAENNIQQPFAAFKAELERHGSATEIKGRLRTDKIFDRLISFAKITEELLDKAAFEELAELERKREAGLPSARFDAGGLEGGELEDQEGGDPALVENDGKVVAEAAPEIGKPVSKKPVKAEPAVEKAPAEKPKTEKIAKAAKVEVEKPKAPKAVKAEVAKPKTEKPKAEKPKAGKTSEDKPKITKTAKPKEKEPAPKKAAKK